MAALSSHAVGAAGLRAFEARARAADARPPELRTDGIGKYSTNTLNFVLNNGLAMTAGGRIWASWISGEDGSGSFTAASWSDDAGETWTDVKLVIDGHDGSDAERTNIIGTFWLDPDGAFHCFTDQSIGHFDGRAGFWESVCRNPDAERPEWSPARRIGDGHVINKPIVLSNGDWALSAYLNDTWAGGGSMRGAFPELDGERGTICYVSSDRGRTWEKRGIARFPSEERNEGPVMDWFESQLVESADGRTLATYARVVDGHRGCLMASESTDGGRTWSKSHLVEGMDNANARFQVVRLRSGRLLFVKHGAPDVGAKAWSGRERLTAYLSDDDGKSWRGGLLLDESYGSYPDAFQAPDGSIYVSHDHGRYQEGELWLHRFTEEDVLAGRIVSPRGKLGMIVMRAMANDRNRRRSVWLNEDNEHFYDTRSADEMTEEGCRELVRKYAGLGKFRGILFCFNMQRALFDSKVWEHFWDQVNPVRPNYPGNLKLLVADRKVDQFAVWLDEARKNKMEAWLTMRMNDLHGLKEAAHGKTDSPLAYWHSKMWEAHPEYRRAPERDERSWEGAYDFGHKEIRRNALALIEEAFSKWDFDGFEFDWLRWGMFFKPGDERRNAHFLTEIVKKAGKMRDAAEKRVGHPIRLGHRVPSDPESALNHGFDVAAWADAGCVQMLTLSTFDNNAEFDLPVALWRRIAGEKVEINAAVGQIAKANPENQAASPAFRRGAAAAAYAAGADGAYLFNDCWLERKNDGELARIAADLQSPASLCAAERRTASVCNSQEIPGESTRGVMPMPLTKRYIGMDFARMEQNMTVRLSAPYAGKSSTCILDLAFDASTPDAAIDALPVKVNGRRGARKAGGIRALRRDNVSEDPEKGFAPFGDGDSFPRDAAKVVSYDVPGDALHDAFNAVEMLPAYGTPGTLVWAQFRIWK